jgi:hypothetical protein
LCKYFKKHTGITPSQYRTTSLWNFSQKSFRGIHHRSLRLSDSYTTGLIVSRKKVLFYRRKHSFRQDLDSTNIADWHTQLKYDNKKTSFPGKNRKNWRIDYYSL